VGSNAEGGAGPGGRRRRRAWPAPPKVWRRGLLAVVVGAVLAGCHPPPEFAGEVVADDTLLVGDPSLSNGVRIYLSSPRHSNSGSRGECGWEENINGRLVNLEAATATYGSYGLADDWEYDVAVSGNAHDDGYLKNREASNNFGADLHLVTHTNANGAGCGDSAQYVLAMFNSANPDSVALANQLATALDPVVPGHKNSWDCDGLAECGARAPHVAYLELFFHTNQAAADWFMATGGDHANGCQGGLCGWAQSARAMASTVDTFLGQPRPLSQAAAGGYALDAHPGFGRSPQAMVRDDTIAYWEAYHRELVVAECMADAGYRYTPAVAYPAGAVRRIAENLPTPDAEADDRAVSPDEANRAYQQALSPEGRDGYFRALYGEAAADIDAAARTGTAPDGRGADFATGGCIATAHDAAPSIWDARRAVASSLPATRDANPERANAAAQDLADDHAALFAAVDARYRGVTEHISDDTGFLTYVAHQAQQP
jgi:hypothetical protein